MESPYGNGANDDNGWSPDAVVGWLTIFGALGLALWRTPRWLRARGESWKVRLGRWAIAGLIAVIII